MSLIECSSPTTDKSIEGMEEALKHGIKQILCRIKHPQSNGKVKKWFDVYRLHRHAFKTKEDFLYWYNEVRPHRALNFEILETSQQAFVRKMKAEV